MGVSSQGPSRRPNRRRFVISRQPTKTGDGTLWIIESTRESGHAQVPDEVAIDIVWNAELRKVLDLLSRQGFNSSYWVISDERDGTADVQHEPYEKAP